MAAAIWSEKDMRSPSGGKARRRGGTQVGKAPPLPEMTISSLTRGQVFGEDDVAEQFIFPGSAGRAARPSGGLFRFWARASCESQVTRDSFAFGTVMLTPSGRSGGLCSPGLPPDPWW